MHFHMLPPVQNLQKKKNAIRCTMEVQTFRFVQAFSKNAVYQYKCKKQKKKRNDPNQTLDEPFKA